jgi:hypothetical protein
MTRGNRQGNNAFLAFPEENGKTPQMSLDTLTRQRPFVMNIANN